MSESAEALSAITSGWRALVPPNRVTPAEGAASGLILKRPGGSGGPWSPLDTPYMVEPLNVTASRHHSGVVFVGGAQGGKTASLGLGWLTHAALNDPGDFMVVQMTQDKAREFKRKEVDRAFRHSPRLKAMLTSRASDNATHDVELRNGMRIRFAWPTVTNFSSTAYRYVFGTDYDRWPDDIDGEGDGWTLMGKRITTFLSRGMAVVESSPGRPITDPTWQPSSPHEAPPVKGVLGIYNTSDRRRFYWKCLHCGEWFEAAPGLGLFHLPGDDELLESIRTLDIDTFARQHARVPCPHCGSDHTADMRETLNRATLQGRGGWLADGLNADSLDRISGTPRTSSIAGFWLGGVAATYVSWESLIRKHLQALLDYQLTSSELSLQTTANTDQAVPYMSRHLIEAARNSNRGDLVEADMQRYVVPAEARFLIAFVDVQGGANARFVVQVHAVGPHKEEWLIDRYSIAESSVRVGTDGRPAALDPGAYPEDWDCLTERVLQCTYRTTDPNREMRVRRMGYDTGGEDGVTDKAYAYYRKLRRRGQAHRVRACKGLGTATKVDWHVRESMVGNQQGKGDIPLLTFDPNKFKDMVRDSMARREPGPGYYHWPAWLPAPFFAELRAEVRLENGVWSQIKARNEALDCCVGIKVMCMDLGTDARRDFWTSPPPWALPQDAGNTEIVTPEFRRAEVAARKERVAPERRVVRSSYMG